MDIPPELFDEILSCLPSDDRRSLQSCSLVAKSWVNPSRRRLFETVHIRATTLRAWQTSIPPADDREPQRAALALQPWLDSIPPANGGLFEYVQWLLQLRSVIASRRDHVPNQPLQGIRSCLQQLRDIIPPAENGLLYYVRSLLQSIRDTIPPEDVELLHHVRSLSYSADTRDRGGVRPEYFSSVLRNYYPSLHQLQHLSLSSVCFVSNTPQDIGMFSAFRHTLSRLSLNSCDFTISTLVSLIDYFPNLNRLDLTRPLSCVNDKPVRPVSRPLLRQLHISEAYEGGFSILDQLSEVGLAFDEIVVDGPSPVSLHTLGRVVDAVGARVRCLKLSNPLETYHVRDKPTTLSRYRELQELEIPVENPGAEVADLLSSITSMNIRKVTFVHIPSFRRSSGWGNLDDPLCRLIGRQGCEHEMEVDFRFPDAGAVEVDEPTGEPEIVRTLTKFRKKGCRVRVFWMDLGGSEHVVYPRGGVK